MKKTESSHILMIEESVSVLTLLLGLLSVSVPNMIGKLIPYFAIAYFIISFVLSLLKWIKARDIKALAETTVLAMLTIALITLFTLSPYRSTVVAILMGFYCVLKSITNIIYASTGKKESKNKLFLTINTLTHLMLAASIFHSLVKGSTSINEFIVMYGIIYIFEGITSFFSAFTKKHHGTLLEVLKETYAKEILSGLILAIITASFLLVFIEPQIASFGDGIWYCFALVTTIGFGDFAAETALGRLISIIVGIYGIIVVALITSVIVNIYTEKKEKEKNSRSE